MDVFKATMKTCVQFLSVNHPVMQDLINVLRAKASRFIKDNRPLSMIASPRFWKANFLAH